jgi:uncharacterized phage protein (TIGR02218 family)
MVLGLSLMSFASQEISTQDGRVATLYRIDWGQTHWYYTSADRAIERDEEVDGDTITVTYEPRAVKDNGMVQGSSSQNDFTLDGPSDLPIVALFRGTPPSGTMWLTVRRVHDDPTDAPIYWKGTITNVKRPSLATCQIVGAPLSASLKRTGLRLCWTRECPHFLYGPGCFVDPADYECPGTVLSFSGTQMIVTMPIFYDSGYFRGGFISWEAHGYTGTLQRRMIEEDVHEDAVAGGGGHPERVVLQIMGLVDLIEVGDSVKMYPGCNRTPKDCDDKFNNMPNYGGFDKMPGASPFITPIW